MKNSYGYYGADVPCRLDSFHYEFRIFYQILFSEHLSLFYFFPTRVKKRVFERVSTEFMHIIRSETLGETFRAKKSRQESNRESRIGLYAWLSARLFETRFSLRGYSPIDLLLLPLLTLFTRFSLSSFSTSFFPIFLFSAHHLYPLSSCSLFPFSTFLLFHLSTFLNSSLLLHFLIVSLCFKELQFKQQQQHQYQFQLQLKLLEVG